MVYKDRRSGTQVWMDKGSERTGVGLSPDSLWSRGGWSEGIGVGRSPPHLSDTPEDPRQRGVSFKNSGFESESSYLGHTLRRDVSGFESNPHFRPKTTTGIFGVRLI